MNAEKYLLDRYGVLMTLQDVAQALQKRKIGKKIYFQTLIVAEFLTSGEL